MPNSHHHNVHHGNQRQQQSSSLTPVGSVAAASAMIPAPPPPPGTDNASVATVVRGRRGARGMTNGSRPSAVLGRLAVGGECCCSASSANSVLLTSPVVALPPSLPQMVVQPNPAAALEQQQPPKPAAAATAATVSGAAATAARLIKKPSGLLLLRKKKKPAAAARLLCWFDFTSWARNAARAAFSCCRCRRSDAPLPASSSSSNPAPSSSLGGGGIKESNVTKCLYTLLLVVATAMMSGMLVPAVQHQLRVVFRDFSATCTDLNIKSGCLKLTGYLAAFKVSFCFASLFAALCLLTMGVTSDRGARAAIHNGFWLPKALLVAALLVAAFVVPVSHAAQLHTAWIYACLAGNWAFVLLQLVCIIDFSDAVRTSLHRRTLRSPLLVRQAVELSLAISVVSLWLVVSVALFLIHGRQEFCLTKQIALITNTGLCIAIMLSSITPCARRSKSLTLQLLDEEDAEHLDPGHGRPRYRWRHRQQSLYSSQLFQSGLVVVYVTFWVWSAMQSAPEGPGFVELYFLVEEGDLVCYLPRSLMVEESLTYAAVTMMMFTLAYVSSSQSEVKRRGRNKRNRRRRNSLLSSTTTRSRSFRMKLRMRPSSMGAMTEAAASETQENNANAATEQVKLKELVSPASTSSAVAVASTSSTAAAATGASTSSVPPPLGSSRIFLGQHLRRYPFPPRFYTNGSLASAAENEKKEKDSVKPSVVLESEVERASKESSSSSSSSSRQLTYSYSLFHLILFLAVAHATTQLTRWYQPYNYALPDLDRSWQTVGLKVACAWSCGVAYLCYLLLPDRCFPSICRAEIGDEEEEEEEEEDGRGRGQCIVPPPPPPLANDTSHM